MNTEFDKDIFNQDCDLGFLFLNTYILTDGKPHLSDPWLYGNLRMSWPNDKNTKIGSESIEKSVDILRMYLYMVIKMIRTRCDDEMFDTKSRWHK